MSHGYNVPSYYNSHYVQAYLQASASASVINHASSSTGRASSSNFHLINNSPASSTLLDSKSFWYQPGNNRCNQLGCTFFGSHKSVETHMMDRHLIYPPGWEKRKKKADWDADPSLKGKSIPIQGTNIIMDSPEVLDAWIAERKKRFPTSSRIEDKKRKLEDAIARGQLNVTSATLHSNKRQKYGHNRGLHPKIQSRTGKNDARTTDAGWGGRIRVAPTSPSRAIATNEASHSNPSTEDDTDHEPEVLSSKIQHASEIFVVQENNEDAETKALAPSQSVVKNITVGRHRISALQPKNPPRNPFASRPTLLRNLLLPEICITVSNLSQAIRFLVDNDFFQDVELSPGQALGQKTIEIVDS